MSKNTYSKITLTRLSKEDGCGWFAEIPEFKGCQSDGKNPKKALKMLKKAKKAWLEAQEVVRSKEDQS